ncbi:hypothetical protein G6F57_020016 [Rhizopus arrhizus]|nr:hypothetical protein G6F57_020016 [Rhizopus arrhizus]
MENHLVVQLAGGTLEGGRADAQVAAARIGRHGVLEQDQFLVHGFDLAARVGQIGGQFFVARLVGVALLGGFVQLRLQALALQVGGAQFAMQRLGLLYRQALRTIVGLQEEHAACTQGNSHKQQDKPARQASRALTGLVYGGLEHGPLRSSKHPHS